MIGIQGGSGLHSVQLRQILRCLVSASKVNDLGGDHNQKKAYLLNTSPLCNGASYISRTLETWELLLVYKGSRRDALTYPAKKVFEQLKSKLPIHDFIDANHVTE